MIAAFFRVSAASLQDYSSYWLKKILWIGCCYWLYNLQYGQVRQLACLFQGMVNLQVNLFQ